MRTTRRELLAALAALGAAACSTRRDGRVVEGSIVGGNRGLGHRLRDGIRLEPSRWEDVGVAILGAGVAGLSAAWTLERAGFGDFVVLELEDAPGGTARSGTGPVCPYPWAAHYVPVPPARNRPLVALLEEVGAIVGRGPHGEPLGAEDVVCREPEERLFFRGEWYEGLYPRAGASAAELAELEAFQKRMRAWAGVRDAEGRRAFELPRIGSAAQGEARELDRMSMADYLEREGWRSERLRWFAEYATRDDFGATLEQTSAWAGVHYFAARLETPESDTSALLTWPEGNGRLVSHLAGLAGGRLRTRSLVTAVRPRRDRVEVVFLDAATGEARGVRAGHAVFALPRFLVDHLVERGEAPLPAPEQLAATVYGSWMVANLTLSDRPDSHGFPTCWDNVLYDSPSLGYVVATHQTGRDHGATVWTYYRPFTDDDPRRGRERMQATPWAEWVEGILADLRRAHPGLDRLVERVDVYLWGHAMVRPRPGFVWSPALESCRRPVGRLHFAHTDLSGFALFEEAQYWGVRAAERILEVRRVPFRSWLE